MPYRIILTITEKKIQTPGPLTFEEANALVKFHNENQLLKSWKYSKEKYEEEQSSEESLI